MHDLGVLIPIIGVSIPLVVVVGRFIVQPIVAAISRHAGGENAVQQIAPVAQRLAHAEERIQHLEKSLERVIEEQEFHRQLSRGRTTSRSATE